VCYDYWIGYVDLLLVCVPQQPLDQTLFAKIISLCIRGIVTRLAGPYPCSKPFKLTKPPKRFYKLVRIQKGNKKLRFKSHRNYFFELMHISVLKYHFCVCLCIFLCLFEILSNVYNFKCNFICPYFQTFQSFSQILNFPNLPLT